MSSCDVDRTSELARTEGRNHCHCLTCSDEATPMTVLKIDDARGLALCESEDGTRQSVEVALVDAEVGATLLVHAGTAIA